MTHITSLVMNTEDLDADDLAAQLEEKQQEKPSDSSISPNFSLLKQTTSAEASLPNDSKAKPP